MTSTATRYVIEAPTRTPNRYGLFSVVDFRDAERAGQQLAWDGFGCADLLTRDSECFVGGTPADLDGSAIDCDNGNTETFTVIALDDSSLGRPPRTAGSSRAADKLRLYEQHAAETLLTEAIGTDAGAGVSVGSIAAALGEVEALLPEEGVILVRRSLIAQAADYFVQTGSLLRTVVGTPVAACSGWGASLDATDVLGVHSLVGLRNAISEFDGFGVGDDVGLTINDRSDVASRDYAFGWDCQAVRATVS